jgi:hypothetical protein
MPMLGMGSFDSKGPGMKGAVAALLFHFCQRGIQGANAGAACGGNR